jgi:hypothetical protein
MPQHQGHTADIGLRAKQRVKGVTWQHSLAHRNFVTHAYIQTSCPLLAYTDYKAKPKLHETLEP